MTPNGWFFIGCVYQYGKPSKQNGSPHLTVSFSRRSARVDGGVCTPGDVSMTADDTPTDTTSTVRKDLDDCDRTAGSTVEHYSAADIAAACHAEEGQSHE